MSRKKLNLNLSSQDGETKTTGHTSAEKQSNSNYLIERNPIPKTPFTAAKHTKEIRQGETINTIEEWYLLWGIYTLSPPLESEKKVLSFLKTNMWDVIAVYTLSVTEAAKQK